MLQRCEQLQGVWLKVVESGQSRHRVHSHNAPRFVLTCTSRDLTFCSSQGASESELSGGLLICLLSRQRNYPTGVIQPSLRGIAALSEGVAKGGCKSSRAGGYISNKPQSKGKLHRMG
eukprot:114546-Pelagomonas_calceolata.AAC.1